MFYVHSLLSTWVFHCSIWISQENICGHICFGTNEEEKYESLPWMRFIKNWRLIAHFVLFQVLSCTVSLSGVDSSSGPKAACVSDDLIWPHAGVKSESYLQFSAVGFLQTMSFLQHKGTMFFFFSFVISKSQIGLKECLLHLLWVPCWTAVVYKKYNSHQNTH